MYTAKNVLRVFRHQFISCAAKS